MSSRPSVEGLDCISAAFDLNADAAPTVTQGNSANETAGEATAYGARSHKDAGEEEEIKDASVFEMVPAGGSRTELIEVTTEKYAGCNDRGQYYRDKLEAASTDAEDGNSRNGIGLADAPTSGQSRGISPSDGDYGRDEDSVAVGVGALEGNTIAQLTDESVPILEPASTTNTAVAAGVEHACAVPATGNGDMNLRLSLSMVAPRKKDSKMEDTCHSMDVNVITSEETPVTETSGIKQENDIEYVTVGPEVLRNIETPILKCLVRENDPETSQLVSYPLPQNHRRGFRVSDLIWGKVKSHPWWPGQIVDPSFASELALKHQRKASHLVAYFGDKTFAWCEDSQLKPFSTFFSQMEKQSSNEGFRDAVNNSLHEVSRRVQIGMVCSCVPKRLYSKIKVHNFDSAGVREGVAAALVDTSECLQMFAPDVFLQYITKLAMFPTCRTCQFDITVAHAQLMAYNRFVYHTKCHAVGTAKGLIEIKGESSVCKVSVAQPISISDYDDMLLCNLTSMKTRSKSGISKKRKFVQEDGRKEKSLSQPVGFKRVNRPEDRIGSRKGTQNLTISPTNSGNSKTKKRRLNLFEAVDVKSPSPTPHKSFVIGECISRVASKLTSLPHTPKSSGDPLLKSKDKADPEYDGPFSLDTSIPLSEQRHLIDKSYENMSTRELLYRFVSIASDPLRADNFCPIIVSFFSDVRLLLVSMSNVPMEFWTMNLEKWDSGSAEGMEPPKEMKRKRGRPKLVSPKANNSFTGEELITHSEIKRKRGRPPKSSLMKNNEKSSLKKNDKNSLEGIEPPQTVKRKRGRPPKNRKDIISHKEDGGKRGTYVDDKKPCKEDDNKNVQMEFVPVCDNSEKLMPDYLNDSYWSNVAVQNNPKKGRRGRKKREETLIQSTDSDLKHESEPPLSRYSTAISDAQTPVFSPVTHNKSNGLVCERRMMYFGEKSAEELNPTALILNFSAMCSLPSEIDLVRIFSPYGPLKESDTELQKHTRRAVVVFKRRADAETAFKEVPFSRFGPALVDFSLKNLPLQSGSTQKVAGAKCIVPIDSGSFEYSGSKNKLFREGSFQQVTNTKTGETSSSSSMVDNLKQNLPSDINDFQTMCSGGCQTSMDMFLGDACNPQKDADKCHIKSGFVALNENGMPVGDDMINCVPEQSPQQNAYVTADTAGCANIEILVEKPSLRVDMVQVPGSGGGSTHCDERGCSWLHSAGIGTSLEVCCNENVVLSGSMHEMVDPSLKNKKPTRVSESLVDNKNVVPLDTCVIFRAKDSMPTDICQMGDQDVKIEESHVVGSSLHDSANMNIISVDVCNFEDVERERKTALDDSAVSDVKPQNADDYICQALGNAKEPAKAELVQGQKVCKMPPFNSEMGVLTVRRGETNLHVIRKDIAEVKDLQHPITCDKLASGSVKEQEAQNSGSPYTHGSIKENSVIDLKSDVTDMKVELSSFRDRKVDEIPGCQ